MITGILPVTMLVTIAMNLTCRLTKCLHTLRKAFARSGLHTSSYCVQSKIQNEWFVDLSADNSKGLILTFILSCPIKRNL